MGESSSLTTLVSLGLAFIVAAIVIGYGASILSDLGETMEGTKSSVNVTFGLGEIEDGLVSWLPLAGLIIAAMIIISIVVNVGRSTIGDRKRFYDEEDDEDDEDEDNDEGIHDEDINEQYREESMESEVIRRRGFLSSLFRRDKKPKKPKKEERSYY